MPTAAKNIQFEQCQWQGLVVLDAPAAESCRSSRAGNQGATVLSSGKFYGGELPPVVRAVLTGISVGDHVASATFAEAFRNAVHLASPTRDVVLGSLMTAMMLRGPHADDIEALLRVALEVDFRPPPERISGSSRPVIVVAGSGKKGIRTLNVSTPASLVAAAAGASVVKIGSSATSSILGSRDLILALGLKAHRSVDGVRSDLAKCGFAFVAVEPQIPILDELYGGRFYAPNPFSFGLAALVSPVRGDLTVFGLSHPRVDVAAEVLSRFGQTEVEVMSTRLPNGYYLDEIGLAGEINWCRVRAGQASSIQTERANQISTNGLAAEMYAPDDSGEAIKQTQELLAGRGLDSHRAVVAVNAAHLLVVGGIATSFQEGRELAEEVLRRGLVVKNVLERVGV